MSVIESREIHLNHIKNGPGDTELRFDTSHFALPCCTVCWADRVTGEIEVYQPCRRAKAIVQKI
jgi:hypothetical protein